MGDDTFQIAILAAFVILMLWGILGASKRARVGHSEAQLRLPGQLAMEVGRTMAHREKKAWQVLFVETLSRYLAAENNWWIAYRKAAGKRKKMMLERRLALQKDIAEFIDPVDCLLRLIRIIDDSVSVDPRHLAEENKSDILR